MPYSSYYIQIFVNNSFLNLITFGTLFRLSDYLQRLLPRNTTTRNQVRSSATFILKKYDHKAAGQIICKGYSQEI